MNERFSRSSAIVAISGLLAFTASSQAESVSSKLAPLAQYSVSSSPVSDDLDNFLFSVPVFNSSLGTLQGVSLSVTYDIQDSATLVNNAASSSAYTLTFSPILTVYLPNGSLGLTDSLSLGTASGSIGGFTTLPPIPFSAGNGSTPSKANIAAISLFEGIGSVSLQGLATAPLNLTGTDGNVSLASQSITSDATLKVTYTYSPVPEPSLAALLLVGVGCLLRRKSAATR